MFDAINPSRKTQLILATDTKHEKYAQLLAAMVTANDDVVGEDRERTQIVGVKDGTVKATIWLEKEYKDSRATTTTNDHFIFIGDNPTTQSLQSVALFEPELKAYGIQVGTVGNNALVFCDKKEIHKQKTYDSFFAEYQRLTETLKVAYGNVSEQKKAKNVGEKINAGVNTTIGKGFTGVAKAAKKVFGKDAEKQENVEVHIPKWVTSSVTGIATALVAWPVAVAGLVAMGASKTKSNAEREAQQMSYAVLWFYLYRLNAFLGRPENG